jgi:hypothetical protein
MRRPVLALALATMLLALSTSAALATTTKNPVWGEEHVVGQLDPGTESLQGTVYSLRGQVNVEDITGSGPATQTSVVNYDIDIVTGTGTLWGTARSVPDGLTENVGGFNCHWEGTFLPGTGGQWTGHAVCHGYGVLRGYQMRTNSISAAFGSTFTGYLFLPGDKTH